MKNLKRINRRSFIQQGGTGLAAYALTGMSLSNSSCMSSSSTTDTITIKSVKSLFEQEPLINPFGFKGSAMTNVWQTAAYLESESGTHKIGLGTQNVLWSDSRVFAKHAEDKGNELMYKITQAALEMIKGKSFTDPISLQEEILPAVFEEAKKITQLPSLRKTFALNALVPVDNALWLLYAAEKGITQFDDLVPAAFQPGLSAKHNKVVSIPALGYGTSMETIKELADQGFFIMKIKIGAPGTQEEMLEKDMAFLKGIHETIGHYETSYSKHGKIPYYFDANGRYEKKETLHRFLDYAEQLGALEQIAVLEEPFGEKNKENVSDLVQRGPRVAADESAHTDADALERIQQGYNAIAVKAIAKTLSMTMKIAQVAYEHQVPCFCADLTVNPILVDWNKAVAARLPAFPEMPNLGLQETNGWQNYRNWSTMLSYHPAKNAPWVSTKDGVYHTGQEFMEQSAGIFLASNHYEKLFNQ